jgi:hypothetical protein
MAREADVVSSRQSYSEQVQRAGRAEKSLSYSILFDGCLSCSPILFPTDILFLPVET